MHSPHTRAIAAGRLHISDAPFSSGTIMGRNMGQVMIPR